MRIKVLIICCLATMMACNSPDTSLNQIAELEGKIYNETTKKLDRETAEMYVASIEKFASSFSDHEKAVPMLLKAGEMSRNLGNFDQALNIYNRIINDFSSHEKAAQAMFLKGFTLDDNLGKKEEAKGIYEAFLEKHPNNEFAESARFMIQNLYKSNAEIIESFEKSDSTKVTQ